MQDWWSDRIDTSIINSLTGNTGNADTRYSGNNATTAPTTTSGNERIIIAGAPSGTTSEASLSDTASHYFSLTLLDKAVAKAETVSPVIRPFQVNGGKYWVCLLHQNQLYQLRQNTNSGQWADIQKSALMGNGSRDNPIFTGAEGVYNNVILRRTPRIPNTVTAGGGNATTANCRRAVFFGAQAASIAVGMNSSPEKMTWVEEYFDYERQLGVSAGMIFGTKKMVFNSIDFSTIVLSTYSPAP